MPVASFGVKLPRQCNGMDTGPCQGTAACCSRGEADLSDSCHCPQVLQAAFLDIARIMATARAAPIQALAFPLSDVATALRQFLHARHIGKIVARLPPAVEAPSGDEVLFAVRKPLSFVIPFVSVGLPALLDSAFPQCTRKAV